MSIPNSFAAISTNWRTLYCTPVAMTKSSGLILLQHQPLHLDVVAGMAPVAQRVEVAEVKAILQSELDARQRAGDLAGDEGFAAHRRFVVEQDAVAGIDAVGLAVVDA